MALRFIGYAVLTLSYALVFMGLLLVIFVSPPTHFWAAGHDYNGDWKPTILVMVILGVLFMISQSPVLGPFLGFVPLASHWHMLIILSVTLLWIGVLRFTWHKHLLERYFDIDLGKTVP